LELPNITKEASKHHKGSFQSSQRKLPNITKEASKHHKGSFQSSQRKLPNITKEASNHHKGSSNHHKEASNLIQHKEGLAIFPVFQSPFSLFKVTHSE